ncbi:MAG: DUF1622 domain-containing protein [Anaerolineales bacterium]
MLKSIIAAVPGGTLILEYIEYAALAIEIIAILVIGVAIFYAMTRYTKKAIQDHEPGSRYHELKLSLSQSLLLGLEILVAADIVRTVALEATLESVITLGLLVLIRTFLGWALIVEIEGTWPWASVRQRGTDK